MRCPVCGIELRTVDRTEQEGDFLFRLQCMNKKCSAFGTSLTVRSGIVTKERAEQEDS